MKVLFAVSNDSISEAIIKRYPKEYRDLLSYKNVYYFNAILKEIQNDKSYDRIVISEDLEPFVNTNTDSIDNFIFEHLDKISDEAGGSDGKEMSIILICSERRTFGSSILNKLFSIGIYNALIGNDRNMTELCKLINRPRTKKEAKLYYRIDQATYDPAGDSGEVSENEIQNILNHFKKLGKNTDRYADSFNNIAAQYTDEQLKLIINVLPMKVKAVLESESEKYQALMGTSATSGARGKQVEDVDAGIKINAIKSNSSINGPIVIPSSVKNRNQIQTNNVVSKNVVTSSVNNNINEIKPQSNVVKVQRKPVVPDEQVVKSVPEVNINKQELNVPMQKLEENNVEAQTKASAENINKPAQRYTGTIAQVKRTISAKRPVGADSPSVKPQSVNNQTTQVQNSETNNDLTALLDGLGANIPVENAEVVQEKRGRGRPKKTISEVEQKPKGKRGRPRKNSENIDNSLNDLLNPVANSSSDDYTLPGLEEDDDAILPGLTDDFETSENTATSNEDSFDILPGLEEEETVFPGLEDIEPSENDDVLPGLDADDVGEEVDVSSLLSGLDDDGVLPGLTDDDSNSSENTTTSDDDAFDILPGLDDDDDILPGLDNDFSSNDGFLNSEDKNVEEELLPGLDEEETILPGMGFDDVTNNSHVELKQNYSSNQNSEVHNQAIESIKPKIDYSMSNLNSLLSKDKKIVTFLGTTKNGTSFLVNNLALMFSLMGIDTAILDMTQNRNSYYIFTDSREELRNIAYSSISKLENGYAEGIKFNKNLSIYTALPADGNTYENSEAILSTLVQNHSLVLIDCDFNTPPAYFASCQEIYLVQSMDILTIQPLTAFIRDLKFKGAWEPEKARVVINKELPVKVLNNKMIIGGLSRYNGPDMSVMTDLFNKDMIKACSIPFDEKVYSKYLETMATCKLSLSGYSKQFMAKLQVLGEMVYPRLNNKKSYEPSPNNVFGNGAGASGNTFSSSTNNTLNKMKNKF